MSHRRSLSSSFSPPLSHVPFRVSIEIKTSRKIQMVDLFKQGKINEARKLVCSQARPEECEEIYRWLYDNLDLISKNEDHQDKAVLIIKQGLVDHSFVADPEINLASVMIKLARLSNEQ